MKKVSCIVGVTLLFAYVALAQDASPNADKNSSSGTATGCLAKSASESGLILKTENHPKGVRVKSSADLSKLLSASVGRTITLAGEWGGMYPDPNAPGGAAIMRIGAGGRPIYDENWTQDFTATKVTHVGNSCVTGGTAKKGTTAAKKAPDKDPQ